MIAKPPLEVRPIETALVARASFRASTAEIPALRKAPGPVADAAFPPALLRHADEQTVVGLAAVLRAIHESDFGPDSFGEWAVLAAPRFLGRAAFERAFPTFRDEGVWGVSPHLIPAHSLHSPSGTISQFLKAHGPNLGVGGTPGSEREGLLFAATMLDLGVIPGVWLVLTGRTGETDGIEAAGDYEALALALVAPKLARTSAWLRISPDEVRLIGPDAETSKLVRPWISTDHLRVDAGHPSGSIPRPHLRPAGVPAREKK